MVDFWEFLLDTENRDVLTWIGSGVAIVCAALWTAFKFFRKPPPTSDKTSMTIQVSGKGNQVAGRDISIGVRGLQLIILIFLILSVSLVLVTQFGERVRRFVFRTAAPLEKVVLDLNCEFQNGLHPHTISPAEQANVSDIIDTLAENDGQVVYFKIHLRKSCPGCGCPRAEPVRDDSIYSNSENDMARSGSVSISVRRSDPTYPESTLVPEVWRSGIEVHLRPGGAFIWSFYIPQPDQLTEDQYRRELRSDLFLSYDGAFKVREYMHSGAGANIYHLETVNANSTLLDQLACIRSGKKPDIFNTLFFGC